MLRSINARAIAQSRLAPQVASASVRRLSTVPRPSTVAFGKRPALVPRSAVFGALSARQISFFNGKEGAVDAAAAPAAPVAAVQDAAPAVVAQAPIEPSLLTPEAPLVIPVPASDIAAAPVEAPLPPAQHLTSTAPDHHFHADPTAVAQGGAEAATPSLHDLIANSGLPLEQVLNSPEAIHAAVTVSDLPLMGLSHGMFNIAGWFRDGVVALHHISDLPWWATIAVFTLGLRVGLLPLIVRNLKHNQRLQAVSPQMQGLMKRINEAKASGDQSAMMVATSNLQKLLKDHNVSPFGPLIMPLFQMPVFLGMFYALKGLAAAPLPALKEGGFGWVLDLTAADPYCILPITSFLFQLTVFKVGVDGTGPNGASSARTMAHMRNGMIALSPLIIFTAWNFPAAVLFYWTTTNAYNLVQAFFLRQQWVRSLFNIPKPPVVQAPPEADVIDPNPSMKDTWNALRGWEADTREKFTNMKLDAEATQAAVQREKALGKTAGTANMYERVNEPVRASSATVETTPAAPAEPITLSREDAKRRRVEAARAKRATQ